MSVVDRLTEIKLVASRHDTYDVSSVSSASWRACHACRARERVTPCCPTSASRLFPVPKCMG